MLYHLSYMSNDRLNQPAGFRMPSFTYCPTRDFLTAFRLPRAAGAYRLRLAPAFLRLPRKGVRVSGAGSEARTRVISLEG